MAGNTVAENLFSIKMSNNVFECLGLLIYNECGIKMTSGKKTMLEGRLRKRLRDLSLTSFEEYYDYLSSPEGYKKEITNMVDAVTTNKTDFFREPKHFEYLVQYLLPEWMEMHGGRPRNKFRIWSAGCSTGEEPYTMAMVLSEVKAQWPGFDFSITATDICTTVLRTAIQGVYHEEKVEPISMVMKKKYLLRSKDKGQKTVRIVPALRSYITFQQLNLMDKDYRVGDKMDVIFCRNVLIYFERPVQTQLLNQFCRYLINDGHLFLGHSETLNNMDVPLTQVAPTVYRKIG